MAEELVAGAKPAKESSKTELLKLVGSLEERLEATANASIQETNRLGAIIKQRDATIKERDDEINALRGQLFAALMDGERMRGYLDGTVDAEAPQMVPAQRERRLDRYTGTNSANFGDSAGYSALTPSYSRERTKRWFER
jgi:hypothetical protein